MFLSSKNIKIFHLKLFPSKADFIIRFQPAKYENKIETRKKIKQEVKIKGKRDVSEFESNVESIYQIGRFNLSLGNTINVQDIILICQTK